MEFSIDAKNIQGIFNLVVEIDGEEELIPTPLDSVGMDLLLDTMVDFIEDAMCDTTYMEIKPSNEKKAIGVVIDMYADDDDDEPITITYMFNDFMDNETNVVHTNNKKNNSKNDD